MAVGNGPGPGPQGEPVGTPEGGVYEWYRRGLRLLAEGHPAAAAQLLAHAAQAEPHARSIREALGRAQFEARMYAEARDSFRCITEASPTDDYAHFGYGLASARVGDWHAAAEHLALAVAMRPDIAHYVSELRRVRAVLAARA